jgi:hypothetical protein
VVGDITRLRQVLLNLLNNAIKFTAGGEIYLQVEPSGESPNLVHFCMEDTGIGIPPDKLDRLFRSFSQVDPSMTRRFGGTGLGLAICRNLTSLMGGRIWVESTVGKGTRFHFAIPLPAASSGADEIVRHSGGLGLALARSPRLVRLLSMWAEELSLKLIVQNEQPDNLASTQLDYLILDADHYQNEIGQVSQIRAARLLLLNRSRNTGKLANQYPNASLLPLPLTLLGGWLVDCPSWPRTQNDSFQWRTDSAGMPGRSARFGQLTSVAPLKRLRKFHPAASIIKPLRT